MSSPDRPRIGLRLAARWYRHVDSVVAVLGIPLEDYRAKVSPLPEGMAP